MMPRPRPGALAIAVLCVCMALGCAIFRKGETDAKARSQASDAGAGSPSTTDGPIGPGPGSSTSPLAGGASIDDEADLRARVLDRDVDVRVLVPAALPPKGLVLVQHGFMRNGGHMLALARRFKQAGYLVVVPTLGPRQLHDPTFAAAFLAAMRSADFLPFSFPVPRTLMLVGHSLGGKFAAQAAAAAQEDAWDVRGTFLLDPVESDGGIAGALQRQIHAPTFLFVGKAHPCNQNGNARSLLGKQGAILNAFEIADGSHCDAEAETSDAPCKAICGKVSASQGCFAPLG